MDLHVTSVPKMKATHDGRRYIYGTVTRGEEGGDTSDAIGIRVLK